MKQYEVIILTRRDEFFPAEDEDDARRQAQDLVGPDEMIEEIEVIEL